MSIVAKVGGKSQDTVEKVEGFAEQLKDTFGRKEPLILVVSAIGNVTNDLDDATKDGKSDITEIIKMHNNYFLRFCDDEKTYQSIVHDFITFYETYTRNSSPQLKATVYVSPERLASFLMTNAVKKVRGRKTLWLDFYDDRFPLIAISGERNYLSASVDLNRSGEGARKIRKLLKDYDIVVPGFGCVSQENGRPIKTFGRGGSDEAAFGFGNIFDADEIWICTDEYGIKAAILEGPYKKQTETLPCLDIEEAKAGAFLGAKLPSEQSLRPLDEAYKTGARPRVYIAHAQHLNGDRTEVIPVVGENIQSPAKLVAGRDISFYYVINGNPQDLLGLEASLLESGIDYCVFVKSGSRAQIGTFGKGSDVADEIVSGYGRRKLSIERYSDRSIVGVVGSGMRGISGIGEKINHALSSNGISFFSSIDYSDFSTVYIVSRLDRTKAVASLYEALPLIRGNRV